MRDGKRNVLHAKAIGELSRDTFELERGLSAGRIRHFNIAPAYPVAPTRPERLHGRFLCRESCGVTLEFVFMPFAIRDFAGRVEPVKN